MAEIISQSEFWEILSRILLSGTLLFFILFIAFWQQLQMTRTIVISYVRGLIQIVLLALVLVLIFNLRNLVIIYLYMLWVWLYFLH